MKFSNVVSGLSAISFVAAGGRPASESICDYYTAALLKTNTEANQETLLTLLVNTAAIGNYTTPNHNAVPGLLNPGYYDGKEVNLLPYFNGQLASTNNGGKCGASVNFLDGGGAAALKESKPAFCTNCNQYFLLTHLYEFFAALLGCSMYGTQTMMPYAGTNGMYTVHKFMALDNSQVGWFIYNVGLAATSFGVTASDAQAVGTALETLFGYRCEPPESVPSYEPAELQSICIDCDCPVSPNPDCGAYAPVIQPKPANKAKQGWCGSQQWWDSRQQCGNHQGGGW